MNPRTLANGDIVFPERGALPPEQEGYIRDAGYPRLFHKNYLPCSKRKETSIKTKCCNSTVIVQKCGDKVVTPKQCEECNERKVQAEV